MEEETDADALWVHELSGRPVVACERALEEARRQRRLFGHLARAHQSEGRRSYVEIDAPLELHALVRLLKPAHVVEVGVSSGVSSAYLLHALELNGQGTLHSVDLPARSPREKRGGRRSEATWALPPGRESGWAVPFPLRKRWDLRLGDKADVLPLLAKELPRVDLLVYDVPHRDETTRLEFRTLDPLLSRGGVVIVDHGPGGELCDALRAWARSAHSSPHGRRGLGLYGFRNTPADGGRSTARGGVARTRVVRSVRVRTATPSGGRIPALQGGQKDGTVGRERSSLERGVAVREQPKLALAKVLAEGRPGEPGASRHLAPLRPRRHVEEAPFERGRQRLRLAAGQPLEEMDGRRGQVADRAQVRALRHGEELDVAEATQAEDQPLQFAS
jgi:hypothetical protein